jgi:hypothetical protein
MKESNKSKAEIQEEIEEFKKLIEEGEKLNKLILEASDKIILENTKK